MAPEPQQQLAQRTTLRTRIRRLAFSAVAPLGVAALTLGILAAVPCPTQASAADHMLCGRKVAPRTQTISMDPTLAAAGVRYGDVENAMPEWNKPFVNYHGFAIFAPHSGNWMDADILLTAA